MGATTAITTGVNAAATVGTEITLAGLGLATKALMLQSAQDSVDALKQANELKKQAMEQAMIVQQTRTTDSGTGNVIKSAQAFNQM